MHGVHAHPRWASSPGVLDWEAGPLARHLEQAGADEASELLAELIDREARCSRRNEMKAYGAKAPQVLERLKFPLATRLLNRLGEAYVFSILINNFQILSDSWQSAILSRLKPEILHGFFQKLAAGLDHPREASRLLCTLPRDVARRAVEGMDTGPALVILAHLDCGTGARLLEGIAPQRRARLLSELVASGSAACLAMAGRLARELCAAAREEALVAEGVGAGPVGPERHPEVAELAQLRRQEVGIGEAGLANQLALGVDRAHEANVEGMGPRPVGVVDDEHVSRAHLLPLLLTLEGAKSHGSLSSWMAL